MKATDYTLSACFHADSLPFGAPEHAAKAWGVLRREPLHIAAGMLQRFARLG